MIYPNNTDMHGIIQRAEAYGHASLRHTHTYAGVPSDEQRRFERIVWGRIGQEWLRSICSLNDYIYTEDPTDARTSDQYDIMISGKKIDVKLSKRSGVLCQVNAALRRHPIDYYCFLSANTNTYTPQTRITALGWMLFRDFWTQSTHVPYGQLIPGTSYKQFFKGGSNILIGQDVLLPFEDTLQDLTGVPVYDFAYIQDTLLWHDALHHQATYYRDEDNF